MKALGGVGVGVMGGRWGGGGGWGLGGRRISFSSGKNSRAGWGGGGRDGWWAVGWGAGGGGGWELGWGGGVGGVRHVTISISISISISIYIYILDACIESPRRILILTALSPDRVGEGRHAQKHVYIIWRPHLNHGMCSFGVWGLGGLGFKVFIGLREVKPVKSVKPLPICGSACKWKAGGLGRGGLSRSGL